MAQPQSFQNHARFDPLVHFSTMPILLLNLIFAIVFAVRGGEGHLLLALWWIVMSVALLLMTVAARGAALRAQDRIIRLEEQLRLADLLPESQLGLIERVSLEQFIALRFASDAEVAKLAARAVAEGLDGKQIKKSVSNWRPDTHRV